MPKTEPALVPGLRTSPYDLLRRLRPLPGRVVVALDPSPSTTPSGLHVPQQAQSHGTELNVQPGEVLTVTPRRITVDGHFRSSSGYPIPKNGTIEISAPWEPFKAGDHVLVLMRLEDVDREVIVTRCERIVAVLEPKPHEAQS